MGSASSHDEQDAAAEHVKFEQLAITPEFPDILFTLDDASEMRRTFKGQPGVLHTKARRHLNEVRDIAGQDGADDVYCIGDSIRWKEYIAMHAQ